MSENPIRPFRPDQSSSAAPRVVMVQSDDSRRMVVILFSVALVLGAGIGILGFLAGRRSEVGKIHPSDLAANRAVQAAKPPPPPVQIVPLPAYSLVREEPPPTPGSPVVGFDGEQPISIEGDGALVEDKPAIVIRRHETKRSRNPSGHVPIVTPVAPDPAPVPAAAPIPPPPDPGATPIPVAVSPEPISPPVSEPVIPTPALDSSSEPEPTLESSPEPPPP